MARAIGFKVFFGFRVVINWRLVVCEFLQAVAAESTMLSVVMAGINEGLKALRKQLIEGQTLRLGSRVLDISEDVVIAEGRVQRPGS